MWFFESINIFLHIISYKEILIESYETLERYYSWMCLSVEFEYYLKIISFNQQFDSNK